MVRMQMLRKTRSVLLAVLVGFAAFAVPLPASALSAADFIAKTYRWAQAEEREYGVPASVALAQSMLESGMGESTLSRNANNWFGIKCSGTPSPHQNGCYAMQTWEVDANGNTYRTTAQFRKYDDPELSFIDHGRFLSQLARYRNAFNYTNNPDRFIYEVHLAGYATDPQYTNKVINLMQQHNLYQYNVTTPATGNSQLAIRPATRANVGATAHVTGLLSPGGGGRSVWTQVKLPSGAWSTSQRVTTGSRGQFNLPLTYGASTVGRQTYRVQAAGPQGTLTSSEFTVERLARVTAQANGTVATGQTANTWGQAVGAPNAEVWTEVRRGESWSRSQTRTTDANGNFEIPLTYGANESGSYTWRVGVRVDGGVYYSNTFTLTRVPPPRVTASSAGTKLAGQDTNAWGTVTGAPSAEVWTEVRLAGRWSRSQTRTTDGDGRFVIPLTYGAREAGTYSWRVGVRTSLGTFYSNEFTLVRTAAPVSVSATGAGTRPVRAATNTWGRAAGAPNAEVWTEVALPGGWSRSQIRTTDGGGNFVIPLTYGGTQVGTTRWRVGVRTADGVFYSNEFDLRRTTA